MIEFCGFAHIRGVLKMNLRVPFLQIWFRQVQWLRTSMQTQRQTDTASLQKCVQICKNAQHVYFYFCDLQNIAQSVETKKTTFSPTKNKLVGKERNRTREHQNILEIDLNCGVHECKETSPKVCPKRFSVEEKEHAKRRTGGRTDGSQCFQNFKFASLKEIIMTKLCCECVCSYQCNVKTGDFFELNMLHLNI